MSFTFRRFGCPASGNSFYSYGGQGRTDSEGRVPCPECGKTVQLRVEGAHSTRRTLIPNHHRAKATGGAK